MELMEIYFKENSKMAMIFSIDIVDLGKYFFAKAFKSFPCLSPISKAIKFFGFK